MQNIRDNIDVESRTLKGGGTYTRGNKMERGFQRSDPRCLIRCSAHVHTPTYLAHRSHF